VSRLGRAVLVLRQRGWRFAGHVVVGVWWPAACYRLVFERDLHRRRSVRVLLSAACCGLALVGFWATTGHVASGVAAAGMAAAVVAGAWLGRVLLERSRLRGVVRRSRGGQPAATTWSEWPVAEATRAAVERLRGGTAPGEPLLLGRFDNDGRVLPAAGELPDLRPVGEDAFAGRYRFDLDLVLLDEQVAVRKGYRGNRAAWLRESSALAAVGGRAGVPALLRADGSSTVVYKSYVPGPTLRDLLVEAGARILTVETAEDGGLAGLSANERLEAVWRRGQEVLSAALPDGTLARLEQLVEDVHRCGVTGFSLTFGNVVLQRGTGAPWLIDFDAARVHRSTGTLAFRRDRDRDRELFNRVYGTALLTERGARRILADLGAAYAPVDLGGGLASRGFWSVDSGTGRWEIVNGPALAGVIEGRRVLDLGSNNGVMPLLMLRHGALEVLGLELSPENVAAAHELQRLFEWRDLRRYAFDVRQSDMRAILTEDLGTWDLVTAFCSLYYLDEDDMLRVLQRALQLAPTVAVQANDATRTQAAEDKAQKSSTPYLEALMRRAGWARVRRLSPMSHPRVLLVGERRD